VSFRTCVRIGRPFAPGSQKWIRRTNSPKLHAEKREVEFLAWLDSPCAARGVDRIRRPNVGSANKARPNPGTAPVARTQVFGAGRCTGTISAFSAAWLRHGACWGMMDRITSPDANIIAGASDPYKTRDPVHLAYHKRNRERGRIAGQFVCASGIGSFAEVGSITWLRLPARCAASWRKPGGPLASFWNRKGQDTR
jgi:hypothetical protein